MTMRNKALFFISFIIFSSILASANDYHFVSDYGDTFYSNYESFSISETEPANYAAPFSEAERPIFDNYDSIDYNSIAVLPPPNVWGDSETLAIPDKFTMPNGLIDENGKLGTLIIPKINLNVSVYEEESLESMRRGVGHFKSTSCWLGNVAMCGHNRGTNAYFGRLKELVIGDEIIYRTNLGERSYRVTEVLRISETDFSKLQRSDVNKISLFTCIENIPELRLCVIAK